MKAKTHHAALFILTSLAVLASTTKAQTIEPLPPIACGPADKAIHEKEKLRVPKAASYKDENGETVYTINGNESWRRTEIQVKRGQRIEVSANGMVRWAPDGIEKIDVTPDGTRPPYRDGWNYYHFPFPEAGIGSLVMRIGRGIYPIGSSGLVEAEDEGFIEFMVNDDKLDDNSGFFSVKVKAHPIEP
jgi:hypothetical protein